jgi:hypothetical protein
LDSAITGSASKQDEKRLLQLLANADALVGKGEGRALLIQFQWIGYGMRMLKFGHSFALVDIEYTHLEAHIRLFSPLD